MAIGNAAKELLSALIRYKDRKTLAGLKESQFASEDEVAAFRKLKRHIARHDQFPSSSITKKQFGFAYENVREPISFYRDNFINRAKFNLIKKSYGDLTEAMSTMDVDTAENIISTIALNLKAQASELGGAVRSFDDIAQDVISDFIAARMSGGVRGITSGWREIDQETGGYQNGDVISWVARLGTGKTWLLLYQAIKAAEAGKRVLFVSPEVPDLQLARRGIGILTGLNPRLIAKGMISSDVWDDAVKIIEDETGSLPLVIAAGNYKKTMPFVKAMVDEVEPDIVCIDAAYLVSPEKKRAGSGGRRESISDVAEEIKDRATSDNIPYNITVQFNRSAVKADKEEQQRGTGRTRRNPLAHLGVHKIGETDVIGQISSLVFASELGDPPNSTTSRWIGIKKGREGEGGFWKINYRFNPFDFSVIPNAQNQAQTVSIDEEELDADLGEA